MDVFEAIAKRHSYRGPFEEQTVPREHLRQIVEAGIHAPSGMNAQTTTFLIVDAPELLNQIRALNIPSEATQTAQAFIVLLVDKSPKPVFAGTSFEIEDCSAAAENMLLAVTALGYATVWIDGWLLLENNAEVLGRILGIPEEKRVKIILPIGVPASRHEQHSKAPFEHRAWFNRYMGHYE